MQEILNAINGWVWDGIGLWMLLGSGVWLTCRNGFFQFRRCRFWLGQVGKGIFRRSPADKSNVSPFQALCTTLAATLGVGNIVGVAAAVTAGGPGSVFWMSHRPLLPSLSLPSCLLRRAQRHLQKMCSKACSVLRCCCSV